jgi:hypothetical protein
VEIQMRSHRDPASPASRADAVLSTDGQERYFFDLHHFSSGTAGRFRRRQARQRRQACRVDRALRAQFTL